MFAEDRIISKVLRAGGFKAFTACRIGSGAYGVRLSFKPARMKSFKVLAIDAPLDIVSDETVSLQLRNVHRTTPPFVEQNAVALENIVTLQGTLSCQDGGIDADLSIALVAGAEGIWTAFHNIYLGRCAGHRVHGDINFPDEIMPFLVGTNFHFDGKITRVAGPKHMSPDDAWARELGWDSLSELSARIRTDLEDDSQRNRALAKRAAILDSLEVEQDFDIPSALIDAELESLLNVQRLKLISLGVPEVMIGPPSEEVVSESRSIAVRRVKTGVALIAFAAMNRVIITSAELDLAISGGDEPRRTEEARLAAVAPLLEDKTIARILELCEGSDS